MCVISLIQYCVRYFFEICKNLVGVEVFNGGESEYGRLPCSLLVVYQRFWGGPASIIREITHRKLL